MEATTKIATQRNIMTSAHAIAKTLDCTIKYAKRLGQAIKMAWVNLKATLNFATAFVFCSLPTNPFSGKKWNGKIYGKKGDFSIYINNQKTSVTDADVEMYNAYMEKKEELSAKLTGVLSCREVQDINITLGNETMFKELTLEQMAKKLEIFQVETVFEGIVDGWDCKIEKCTHEGKFVRAFVDYKKEGKTSAFFCNEEDMLKELKDISK